MILTFSSEDFVRKILNGTKKHTIRKDEKGRWVAGKKIHFWLHNPRNISNNPMQFAEGECTEVSTIEIDFKNEYAKIITPLRSNNISTASVLLVLELEDKEALGVLAYNDGFENWQEMRNWFTERYLQGTFEGRIITWSPIFKIVNEDKLEERGLYE